MNEGVKILIDRMESSPEDFEDRDFEPHTGKIVRGKFRSIADMLRKRLSGEAPAWDAMNVLTTEDIEALTAAYVKMERKKFTNGVMAKLLEGDKEDSYAYQPAMTLGSNGSLGVGTSSGSNGSFYTTTTSNAASKVTIATPNNGPTIDFNAANINTLNEMITKWRGEDDGTI